MPILLSILPVLTLHELIEAINDRLIICHDNQRQNVFIVLKPKCTHSGKRTFLLTALKKARLAQNPLQKSDNLSNFCIYTDTQQSWLEKKLILCEVFVYRVFEYLLLMYFFLVRWNLFYATCLRSFPVNPCMKDQHFLDEFCQPVCMYKYILNSQGFGLLSRKACLSQKKTVMKDSRSCI